nr:DUF2484 family protein [Pseudaestuariivita rosea]
MACLWILTASIMGMIPSKDNHWTRAYFLIAVGIPLLVYLIYQNGPVIGFLFLLAATSILRWPVIYLWRWIRRMVS